MNNKKTRLERLLQVTNIINKLKNCPISNNIENPYINLWNDNYLAIVKLKTIFQEYINQNESHLVGLSGSIPFPEINKILYYKLPINKHVESECILKGKI